MSKDSCVPISNFEPSDFERVSNFELRVSDFKSAWLGFGLRAKPALWGRDGLHDREGVGVSAGDGADGQSVRG
jgi:hypothetical protein